MIYLIGLSIACFLFMLLLLKKKKKKPDYIFMVWIFVLTGHLLLFYLHYIKQTYQYPFLLGLILPLPVLHGAFLYFYTKELTGNSILKIRRILLHLLPFIVLIVLAIPFYRLSLLEKIEVFQKEGKGFEWYILIQFSMILVCGFAYSIASIVAIHKHREIVFQNFSSDEKILLRWLEYLAIGLGLIWLCSVFFSENALFIAVVVFILFIGFFGINQVPVVYSNGNIFLTDRNDPTPNPEKEAEIIEKYAKTGLKEEDSPEIMKRLEVLMHTEKPFQNGELTLNELAEMLHFPPNQLSQVINSLTGKTFYHYINTYRINEFLAIASLPENKKYTFLALAYDCGFNSKTTFNKYFKLHTGKTPSDYFDLNFSTK